MALAQVRAPFRRPCIGVVRWQVPVQQLAQVPQALMVPAQALTVPMVPERAQVRAMLAVPATRVAPVMPVAQAMQAVRGQRVPRAHMQAVPTQAVLTQVVEPMQAAAPILAARSIRAWRAHRAPSTPVAALIIAAAHRARSFQSLRRSSRSAAVSSVAAAAVMAA